MNKDVLLMIIGPILIFISIFISVVTAKSQYYSQTGVTIGAIILLIGAILTAVGAVLYEREKKEKYCNKCY